MSAEAQIKAPAIPEDVLKAAHETMQAINSASGPNGQLEAIAAAIIAERERCASIAEYFSQACVCSEWSDDARGAGYYACADVAAGIRNQSPPKQPSPPINDDDLPF